MATIRFIVKRKAKLMPIYLRLRHGKNVDLSKDTSFKVLPDDWNFKKQQPKGTTEQGKIIALNLSKLKTSLLSNFNEAIEKGISISPEWLADQINIIQNRGTSEQQDKGDLLTYTDYYINYLPTHVQRNGKRGVSKNTIQKFVTLKARLVALQEAKKRKYNVSDINPDFINMFDAFLRKNNYSDNYIGTLSINLKTMCKNARKDGLNVSPNLDNITGVKEDTEKIILTFNEIEQIKKTNFKREALSNARDWLIIGCFTGQRVSDLLKLTKDNIVFKSGMQLIELSQIKTGKKVSLPLHPEVKEILDKREGNFPYKISDVKFNLYIKDVCKLADINQLINGSKINPKTKRKRSLSEV